MIPLALFLLGCLAVYVGTVQAAFSALMPLSIAFALLFALNQGMRLVAAP